MVFWGKPLSFPQGGNGDVIVDFGVGARSEEQALNVGPKLPKRKWECFEFARSPRVSASSSVARGALGLGGQFLR